MVKIITANLGGSQNIIDLKSLISAIKSFNPDIVLLQEVTASDEKNTLNELNGVLKYPHSLFSFQFDSSKDYGKGVLQDKKLIYGLGILSKLKFKSESVNLPIIKGQDRWPRIAIKYSFDKFSLCNVHMSKLLESRALAVPKLPKADIYAGDFNMQPDELKKSFKFKNSFDFKKYLSFPSKQLTLDYVLLVKGSFIKLEVIGGVSDHNGLFVELKPD